LKAYRKDVGPQYRGQVQMYGKGWADKGLPVRWVRIVFLTRSNEYDDSHEWDAPYDQQAARAALGRRERLALAVREQQARGVPVDFNAFSRLPGPDCNWCPFLHRGQSVDAHGCPGDIEGDAAKLAKLTAGIIAPH
jgi:hypothetical protein